MPRRRRILANQAVIRDAATGTACFDIGVRMRYTGFMNISVPLPPHLDQFVREQLASGCFQSEADVVRAALHLMEDRVLSQKRSPTPDECVPSDDAVRSSSMQRSPRGIFADIRSYISPDDIKDARSEMWSGFPHSEA